MRTEKLNLWERKLLDLTLNNALIHVRFGSSAMALTNRVDEKMWQNLCDTNHIGLSDVDHRDAHRLQSDQPEELMQKQIKKIMRAAATNLSEIGSEQLFLTAGMLEWLDNPDPLHPTIERKKHLAPILLLPVHIVRQRITGEIFVHPTGDDPILNVTLVELLYQEHDRDLRHLIKESESGVDFGRVMNEFTRLASSKEGWSCEMAMCIGLFSFSKFLMWNDVHSNSDQMRKMPIVESLVQKRLLKMDALSCQAKELDCTMKPQELALPIMADSSQMEAIVDACSGKSFLLYGPPGTGKSQTITNAIANALVHGKTVLFVAQKRAALEVVQNRLSQIGLAPYCLELHSNKISKSHLMEQLSVVLDQLNTQQHPENYEALSEQLFQSRQKVRSIIEKIHKKEKHQGGEYSLADCIDQCIALDQYNEPIEIDDRIVLQTTMAQMQEIESLLDEMESLKTDLGDVARHPLHDLLPRDGRRETIQSVQQQLQQLREDIIEIRLNQSWWRRLFCLGRVKKRYQMHLLKLTDIAVHPLGEKEDLDEIQSLLSTWLSHWSKVNLWSQWSTRYIQISQMGLEEVARMADSHSASEIFHRLEYQQNRLRAEEIIQNDNDLVMFRSNIFETSIQKYQHQAQEYQQLTKQYISSLMYARCMNVLRSPNEKVQEALTSLRRWINCRGRSYSIRNLFIRFGDVIRQLCPCMLMSPISVAQFLPIELKPFHLVFFDEASQIPTCEAVGAMARGMSVVVVGDPKQMPPTQFFQTQINTDDDPENEDMESILDDCITLGMQKHYLNYHYRSRHESLIAFSNQYYYNNRLLTFPSADNRDSHIQLEFVGGEYDYSQQRTNRKEAEKIVDKIVELLKLPEEERKSIGVIAFSKVQQDLIEDLLSERISKNPQLEQAAYSDELAEPLFVKNLENVQGDERDIILFSICYGPDKDGKISMNFGPLNQTGGERRLNVAITRARQQIIVYSSMHHTDIDLTKTQAEGVKGLKGFLYYAEHGTLPIDENIPQVELQSSPAIAEQIAERLRNKGWQVDTQIGNSRFRIDVAVVDSQRMGHYALGIILDGESYYQLPMTNDRENIMPSILEGLGWQLMHVWQLEYLQHPDRVLQKIEQRLAELKS